MKPTIENQIKYVGMLIRNRTGAHPRLIRAGKISLQRAEDETMLLRAVLGTLERARTEDGVQSAIGFSDPNQLSFIVGTDTV